MSQGLSDAPDLEFEYSDSDKWTVELSGESDSVGLFISSVLISAFINQLQTKNNALFSLLFVELYSYTEGPEFLLNRKCFEEDFHTHSEY